MTAPETVPPIHKTIEVAMPPTEAFRIWTDEIGRRRPLATHSVGQAAGCSIEPRVGGRLYETTAAGEEHLWARSRSGIRRTVSPTAGIPVATRPTPLQSS